MIKNSFLFLLIFNYAICQDTTQLDNGHLQIRKSLTSGKVDSVYVSAFKPNTNKGGNYKLIKTLNYRVRKYNGKIDTSLAREYKKKYKTYVNSVDTFSRDRISYNKRYVIHTLIIKEYDSVRDVYNAKKLYFHRDKIDELNAKIRYYKKYKGKNDYVIRKQTWYKPLEYHKKRKIIDDN